uniref:Uncharacterized protein n=1 Tax=Catharus ustulatus TaxID=91951 RepID=A0A8C3TNW5_CATUS
MIPRLSSIPGHPSSPHPQLLTHAAAQVCQDIIATQGAQHIQELPHRGPAGTAPRPLVQQRARGVGQPFQPPDLQEAASQRLGQRRPVGGRGRPRVEVEPEAAANAVIEGDHGHGVQVQRWHRAGHRAGLRRGRGHGRALRGWSRSREGNEAGECSGAHEKWPKELRVFNLEKRRPRGFIITL